MDVERKSQLKTAMLKVISEENLRCPDSIQIRSPIFGVRKTMGSCILRRIDGRFRLIVSTTKANFVPDPDGEYFNRETGQKLRRLIAKDIDDKNVVQTAAHEIAHLKFWNHTPEHYSYTEHLFRRLCEELQWVFV